MSRDPVADPLRALSDVPSYPPQVGDDVPLAKVLEEGSDWKGRREQIIALRDQVRALRAAQVSGRGKAWGYIARAGAHG